jgi:hypothetical protein
MSHRPAHYEDSGEECCSMDRRKYLSTLAAGAAFGAVAVGAAACGSGGGESTRDNGTTTLRADSLNAVQQPFTEAAPLIVQKRNLWGYLRVFPAHVTSVGKATEADLRGDGIETFRIPFFNNTGIDISASNPIVGFTLLKIGCPAEFVIAINLTRNDDPDHHPSDTESEAKNNEMDGVLTRIGIKKYPWTGVNNEENCEPPKQGAKE